MPNRRHSHGTFPVGHKYAVVDVATNSTTVTAQPVVLYAVYCNTSLSANACPIQDNTTAVVTLPASWAAGSLLDFGSGIRFETSLVVDPDDAGTGNITLVYGLQ